MITSELHLLKIISVMHVKAWHVFISIVYIDILGRAIFNISHLITIMGGGGNGIILTTLSLILNKTRLLLLKGE